MRAQVLDRTLVCYRIGDPDGAFPIFDATGSRLFPGRWNTAQTPLIYASRSYSTAMLEKLVHGGGRLPPNQHFVRIELTGGLSYEVFDPAAHPGWDEPGRQVGRDFGSTWAVEQRSLALLVPSIVARMEENVLINPAHPEFARVGHDLHRPVWWDARLFG
ncbi:RES family NAD+ phosphorylase [Zavarzinia sp. CC-PAN008]|uniref:RES family NAD+ phosphorylase n=1 Tax=Zavarzinia sp. CC-PAN008 TaxID=3243332 RepID=UPI003F742350